MKDLIDSKTFIGNYYVEGIDFEDIGEGFGFAGEKEIYPEVYFTLIFENIEIKKTEVKNLEENLDVDNDSIMNAKDNLRGTPVSVKIRERIAASRKRFHSNDNIAEFIEPGELEALLDEVEVKMKGVLESLVIDTVNDHNTNDTARRVAKMYLNEVFKGRYLKAPAITEFPNAEHLNELMIVGPITVRSACSHHFCPVIGKICIGVLPNERTNVIGLSKYARLAEWVMGRPQIQEEAVVQLADLIQEKTQPDGLAIVMEASHFCMSWRGVKDMDSKMINSVMRGAFLKDPNLRREFLSLIPKKD